MTRVDSTREHAKFDILKFLFENEGFQPFKNIEESCSEVRLTIKKYLDELKDEELVEQSLDGRHPYRITGRGRKHFERLVLKRDIYDLTDSFETKWLNLLRNLVLTLTNEGTNPKEFLDRNCLAFIGGIPYPFHKSIDGMKEALRKERELRERARKEGLTFEEYYRKRLKNIDKQPTKMRKLLASIGWTEEQIEARMHPLENAKKQGIPRVWTEIHKEEIRKKEEETRARIEYKREKYATSG